jgi:formylglycine-generating enzyme required for sulfatase activity
VKLIETRDLVEIPGGWFLMGCETGQENERPVHRVWVDEFALGRYPVTNQEYAEFLEQTRKAAPRFWMQPMFADGAQPVVGVSWVEATAFCDWLSEQLGRAYRLPTEAEWERAACGGTDGALYPWGDTPPWEMGFIGRGEAKDRPARVGVNPPNGFGLHDMSEGVHEWCSDYYDPRYYAHSPERNPQGAASGERRSSRGGSWRHRIQFSRCAARSSLPPAYQYADYGFRVAARIE